MRKGIFWFCFFIGRNSMENLQSRLKGTFQRMNDSGFDVLIVSSNANIQYLFGHTLITGDRLGVAVVTASGDRHIVLNEIFSDQIGQISNEKVHYYKDGENPLERVLALIPMSSRVGIDKHLNIATFLQITSKRDDLKIRLSDCIERQREIKGIEEINILRQSSRITDSVMHQIGQLQHFPTTEREVVKTIRSFYESSGVHDLTFLPIIASGNNTANPHHRAGDKFIEEHKPLLIDMGGKYNNYCSDMTRMFSFSKLHGKFLSHYDSLKEVQNDVLEIMKPGIELREIDLFIRNRLEKRGLAQYFIHATGHGIGLEAYEYPFINKENKETLKEGMVVTIGPGLYFEGEFGIRLEDVVCVTETGCENLNKSPKELVTLEFQ